jgi:NDP-sugar pyrophosphorylase family protein
MTLPVALLAGGLATRLHPVTQTIPKALLSVAGKAFIEWQLGYLQQQGIQRVVICIGHLGEQIQEHIEKNCAFDLQVAFSSDGDSALGTGGALKKALPLLDDAFFVLYGDSYLSIDYQQMETIFQQQPCAILMSVFKNTLSQIPSNVHFEHQQVLQYNKQYLSDTMDYIDYGLSIIATEPLRQYFAKPCFDLADFYRDSAQQGLVRGYEVFSRCYEIGSHQGLWETDDFLVNNT